MIAAHALVHCKPAGAAKPREGADRGLDESLLSEATRDATEAVERSDAAAGDNRSKPQRAGETPAPQSERDGGGRSGTDADADSGAGRIRNSE